jgi:putative FmdB family regulatory protein
MPAYEYVCQDCGKPFERRATMAEYAKGLRPTCPRCGSQKAIRAFTSVNVLTVRRSRKNGAAGCGPTCGPAGCG